MNRSGGEPADREGGHPAERSPVGPSSASPRVFWTGALFGGAVMGFAAYGLLRNAGGGVLDVPLDRWLLWFAGGLVVHDGIVAPLTLLTGRAVRRTPLLLRTPVQIGLALTAMAALLAYPLVRGYGVDVQEGNASVLPANYDAGLAAAVTVVWLLAATLAAVRALLPRGMWSGAVRLALGVLLLAAAACSRPAVAPEADQSPALLSSPDGVTLALVRVARARMPVAFAQLGSRLYVGELESGRILLDGREVADLAVSTGAESGLESLAVGPGGRRLFAYYSASSDPPADGGEAAVSRVARFVVRRDGSLGAARTILEVPGAGVHNAGAVGVGPDGLVYVNIGDNIRRGAAQDLSSPFGKILRLRPDGRPAPGNPFRRRAGADPRVWAWGIRNTFAFTWLADGRMVGADNGERAGDEINLMRAGANYGWPPESQPRAAVAPLLVWPDTFAPAGVTRVPRGWGSWSQGAKVLACGVAARRMDLVDLDRPEVPPRPVLRGCPFTMSATDDGGVLFATDEAVWRLALAE